MTEGDVLLYPHAFSNPTAPAIRATGKSRRKPPAKMRHRINAGTASTRRIVAPIFAAPQVNLNARPIALTKSQIARIVKIISNNVITPFCFLDYMIAFCDKKVNSILWRKQHLIFALSANFDNKISFAFDLIVFFEIDFLVSEHLFNPELQGFNRDRNSFKLLLNENKILDFVIVYRSVGGDFD